MIEPIREPLPETPAHDPAAAPAAPLRWHGFLVNCLLWINAAVLVFQAAWILAGKIYYTAQVRAQVYAGIPGLRIADIALAACLLIASALMIAARGKLKARKGRGAGLLAGAYALLCGGQAAYALARFFIAGLSPLNVPVLAQLLAYGALLWVCRSYYRKRRGLFQGKERL